MGRRRARAALPPRARAVSEVGGRGPSLRGRRRGRAGPGPFSPERPGLWVLGPSLNGPGDSAEAPTPAAVRGAAETPPAPRPGPFRRLARAAPLGSATPPLAGSELGGMGTRYRWSAPPSDPAGGIDRPRLVLARPPRSCSESGFHVTPL